VLAHLRSGIHRKLHLQESSAKSNKGQRGGRIVDILEELEGTRTRAQSVDGFPTGPVLPGCDMELAQNRSRNCSRVNLSCMWVTV
jgi:hypothetical protein